VGEWARYVVIGILVIYMIGAMSLKYAAGSKSFVAGFSQTIYGDKDMLQDKLKDYIDPYYIGLFVFTLIVIGFSLGNIENSKGLQIVCTAMRMLAIACMLVISFISIFVCGMTPIKEIEVWNITHLSNIFGGTVFIFICHHSLSGIIYPIRPQAKVKPMLFLSFSIGGVLLLMEAFLATLAY
jgi:hypothetical protein